MQVTQIATLLNNVIREQFGEEATLLNEDLSNVVDVGSAVFNATSYDKFTKALVDHIGKVIFVDRRYEGTVPSVIYDGFEFGSVLEKIGSDIPQYSENETWSLNSGESYDPNIFYGSSVYAKFFAKYVTFEVDLSVTDKQVKSAFSSASELNRFVEMLFGKVEDAMTLASEALVMRTINGAIAETIYADYGATAIGLKSGVKAINLLYLYNQAHQSATLTQAQALKSPEFIRFASAQMMKVAKRLKKVSKLYNVGGKERFTPTKNLKIVLHSDFSSDAQVYLYSNTFHEDYVKLPKADEVPYWQGVGNDPDNPEFTTAIDLKLPSNNAVTVKANGIIGVMFDEDCCGMLNFERYTTSNYNAKAEFTNYFHKQRVCAWYDANENCIVFLCNDDDGNAKTTKGAKKQLNHKLNKGGREELYRLFIQ